MTGKEVNRPTHPMDRNPSYGQNGQLVQSRGLVHSGLHCVPHIWNEHQSLTWDYKSIVHRDLDVEFMVISWFILKVFFNTLGYY